MGINGRYLLVDSVIVTKSASQENCWLKWGNLLEDLMTVTKYATLKICWQKWGRGKSPSRFSNFQYICQSGNELAEIGW